MVNIPIVTDEKDIDLNDLDKQVRGDLLLNRKRELSSKITKLYHKADQLAKDKADAEDKAKKAGEKLDKTLAQIDRLQKGDWTVLKELNDKPDKSDEPGGKVGGNGFKSN